LALKARDLALAKGELHSLLVMRRRKPRLKKAVKTIQGRNAKPTFAIPASSRGIRFDGCIAAVAVFLGRSLGCRRWRFGRQWNRRYRRW